MAKNLATGEEFEDVVDFVINGGGVLNKWKWPEIAALHDSKESSYSRRAIRKVMI